jgi:hypothetical protein
MRLHLSLLVNGVWQCLRLHHSPYPFPVMWGDSAEGSQLPDLLSHFGDWSVEKCNGLWHSLVRVTGKPSKAARQYCMIWMGAADRYGKGTHSLRLNTISALVNNCSPRPTLTHVLPLT